METKRKTLKRIKYIENIACDFRGTLGAVWMREGWKTKDGKCALIDSNLPSQAVWPTTYIYIYNIDVYKMYNKKEYNNIKISRL